MMFTKYKRTLFALGVLLIALCVVLCGCTTSKRESNDVGENADVSIDAPENSLLEKLNRTYEFDWGTGKQLLISLSEVSDNELIFEAVEIEKGKETGRSTIKMIAYNIEELYEEGESFKAELEGFQDAFDGLFKDERHLVELYDDHMVILALNPDDSVSINSGIRLEVKDN